MKMVWINLESMEDLGEGEPVVLVPENIFNVIGSKAILSFGQRNIHVKIEVYKVPNQTSGLDFDNPLIIRCSHSIIQELLIEKTNVYRMQYTLNSINIGPVIGLLLGEQQYYYHQETMNEYTDAMSNYQKIGGLVFAFKSCAVDVTNKCIYGLYFNHQDQQWKYSKFPIPTVVYRRAFNISEEVVSFLKTETGGKVFNSRRFTKWQMYKKIRENPQLKDYLPETLKLDNLENLKSFLSQNRNTILKPISLSRGRGICIIRKGIDDLFHLHDYHDGSRITTHSFTLEETLNYIKDRNFTESNYIIQPYLDLAKINGSPWDIRVVMQKNKKQEWACHGIECRVAGSSDLVTNISRGGAAYPISKALKLSFGPGINTAATKNAIIQICKVLSECIEKDSGTFAELGIDIAMDTDQNFWIIEANVRPTYNGFKRNMNYLNYLHLCSAPVAFASILAGFERN